MNTSLHNITCQCCTTLVNFPVIHNCGFTPDVLNATADEFAELQWKSKLLELVKDWEPRSSAIAVLRQRIFLKIARPQLIDEELTCPRGQGWSMAASIRTPYKSVPCRGALAKDRGKTEERRDLEDQAGVDAGKIHERAGGHWQRIVLPLRPA